MFLVRAKAYGAFGTLLVLDFHGFTVEFWQSMNSELFSYLHYARDRLPSSYSLLYLCSHLTKLLNLFRILVTLYTSSREVVIVLANS
jgi:hypothetical protein